MGSVCSTSEDKMSPSSRTAPDAHSSEGSFNGTGSHGKSKGPSRLAQTESAITSTRRKIFSLSRTSDAYERKVPHKHIKSEADHLAIRNVLREQTILSALSAYDLDEIIEFMDIVSLKGGQRIDLAGCLCVVLDGTAMLCAADGAAVKNAHRYDAHMAFGQFGLFHDKYRSTGETLNVMSEGSTRICKLPGSAYRMCMEFSRQAQIKANMRLLSSIPIFAKLSVSERVHISDASEVKTYGLGDNIIREGEPGEHFYILRAGGAAVSRGVGKDGKPQRIDYKYAGDYFGEAALLESAPRNATVTADKPQTEALSIDRELFQQKLLGPLKDIMERSETTIQQQMLVSVPLLSQLPADKRTKLADCLRHETYGDGTFIFRQGEIGDRLYIIKVGEVSVLSSGQLNGSISGGAEPREIDHLYNGQYFGERALLKEEPRMASVRARGKVEVYSLSKENFERIGISKEVAWSRRWDQEDTRDVSKLKVVKAMGAGAFGTAWLVLHQETEQMYALKALEKHQVKRQNWTNVVMREKEILSSLAPHPCVITLHNSFQSPTQLFMLMELATGGELFTLIERFERFELPAARFYSACVILAIGHLHKHGVIFRDLKPENLLLAGNGYLKLIDMGFAKRIGRGEKTYTLCGTPYYLAPEMILHRGHGFALDWWTVGVLTYEIIEGEPPFGGSSEMEVYGKVTRLQYTCGNRFSDPSADFIGQLLQREPENRLGALRNGTDDVMAHPWFYNWSWDALLDGSMAAPYIPPPPKYQGSPPGQNGTKKVLDLSNTMTNPNDFGYWPSW